MSAPSEPTYPLLTVDPSFSYTLQTDVGSIYAINIKLSTLKFIPTGVELDDVEVFEFELLLIEGQATSNDKRLHATVYHVISKLLTTHRNVVLYLCDYSDGRGAQRAKLFDTWYKRYCGPETHKLDGMIRERIDSELDIYVSVIMNRDNPYLGEVENSFYAALNRIDFDKNPGATL